ncbi:succinate-semialdehyde dehydrogenase [Exophiala aquamarina CBS 119918]|uniref:Succinate-semialdehyde dehydrogenase n=1 Tax=Exophiala aquamarina CBS 119918 TaxID=1182545 RepID=A0A072PJ91_9EURO|nr:succinate-semialdehyde dehydrogenase [Exophiala aquamarina CBS 119918]KEF59373.1 succinate-semialdehyde dehydrogenase [Exophiala aquamarina CBS 119918]
MGSIATTSLPFTLQNQSLYKDQAYVDGQWVEAKSGNRFDIVDPGSGRIWATCADMAAEDVDNAVNGAYKAFQKFRIVSPRARADLLLRWDALIRANKEDIATILVHETGKPYAEAIGEIEYATSFTRWFAAEAERVHGTVFTPSMAGRRVFTIKQPIGVAAALVPWNFPIAMILRKAAAALAAGCTMIVKPSPETPLSALTLAHLAEQAGFGQGVFSVLPTTLANTPALSEALCKHEYIKKVTFTGSTRVGKLISQHCSSGLKKLTLELGGNCPFLIFDDANLVQACDALMALKYRHAGQACITANRVYVQSGVYDKVAQMLVDGARKLRVGHGMDKTTTMGPLTVPAGIEKVASQIKDAVSSGGKVLTGGQKIEIEGGYFFEPTIIGNATPSMQVSSEETFGPLLALFPFSTEEEAITAANNTSMGLASYFFTKNIDRTWRLLENLESGMIGMNTGNASAAEAPFGGIKDSGYGKESGKDVAIQEYMITKTGTLTLEGQN